MKASFRALPLIALFALPAAAGDAAVAEILPPWFDSVCVGMTTNEFLALDLGADPSDPDSLGGLGEWTVRGAPSLLADWNFLFKDGRLALALVEAESGAGTSWERTVAALSARFGEPADRQTVRVQAERLVRVVWTNETLLAGAFRMLEEGDDFGVCLTTPGFATSDDEFSLLFAGVPSVTLAPQVRAFLCRDASRTAREALGSGDLSGAREACRWGVSTARPEDAPDILEWTFLWVELLECDLGLADDASFARDLGAFRKAVPDPYWPSKMEVEQLLWKGRYDEALRRLETAPEFSNHSDPMITLAILTTSAEVHERTGAAERAEELVRAVLEQKPNHPGALCVLARLRLRAGDADGALAAAQQSLDAVGEGLFLPAGRGVLLLEKARALAAKGETEVARALVGEVRKHLFEGVPAGTAADLAELSGKLGL